MKPTTNQLTTGLRLFVAGLILYILGIVYSQPLLGMIVAGIAAMWPHFSYKRYRGRLANGAQAEEELLKKIKTKNDEQLASFKSEMQELVNQAKAGAIDKKTFEEKFSEITDKLKAFDAEKFKAFEEAIKKYEDKQKEHDEALKRQGEELKKLTDGGMSTDKGISPFRKELKKIMESADFKAFVESGGKRKASFEVKVVDVTNDYDSTSRVHITTRDSYVLDHPPLRKLNIRDLLTVTPTDLPYLAFLEVYEWDRNIDLVAENGSLSESAFKVREKQTEVKRLGTFIELSKRMLKSAPYIENHIVSRLPQQVRFLEDFQFLFGDGQGNNLTGIFEVADDFATLINSTLTGGAASVSSIEAYDGGVKTKVNFAANQDINNGDLIDFGGGAGASYTSPKTVFVISPREIVIEVPYVAEATADWTWVVTSKFKNTVFAAQHIDVLKVAKTLITRQEYSCTGIVLHPDDVTKIELLKGNDEHYIDVKRLDSGIMTIAGVPVVETTAMPSGRFAVGDWRLAAAVLEFTSLILEFSESTAEKKTNTVVLLAHEELLFPIYNRFMFVVGEFSSAIMAIDQSGLS